MLSIAVYSDNTESISCLRSTIQDVLIDFKLMAKVSIFNEPDALVMAPSAYDIYILDMDAEGDTIALGKQMREIDDGGHFIYISENEANAYKAYKAHADHFLIKPIDESEFLEVFGLIKKEIKDNSIIIDSPAGERRIRINNLNYVNIVKRCLCYHLKDGAMFDGQTLRSSFEKAITPLQHNKTFLFLPPSLLINLSEIKIVNSDNLTFENDEVLYFPKKAYELVRERWRTYNQLD